MTLETTELPRILMAMSSILVEWLFRITTSPRNSAIRTTRERVMIQVLLWMAVSLQPPFSSSSSTNKSNINDPSFDILIHGIFFVNLIVLIMATTDPLASHRYQVGAFRRRRGICMGLYRNMCAINIVHPGSGATGGEQTKSGLVSLLEKASPSLWLALMWAYIEGTTSSGSYENTRTIESKHFQIAAGTFVILNVLSYAARIYQAHLGASPQQSSSLPASLTISNLDEADWRHWTVSDVMLWLYDTSPLGPGDSESVLTRLAWERVDGPTLVEHLDHDALRHMDIPYGPACVILEHVQNRIKRRYPEQQQQQQQQHWYRSNLADQQQQQQESSNTFLAQYDQEYQLSLPERRRRQQQESQHSWSHHVPAMNEEEVDHVREQLLQRWGFSAPEVAGEKNTAGPKSNATLTANGTTPELPDTSVSPRESEREATMLDESLLQTIPPHIRDILQEKPHLWEQVKARNKGIEVKGESGTSHDLEQTTTNPHRAHGELKHPPSTALVEEPEPSTPEKRQIPRSVIDSLPPHIREVAQRNPQLFQQMITSRMQSPHSESETGMPIIPESVENEEDDETVELLPRTNNDASNGNWLRQRPGF